MKYEELGPIGRREALAELSSGDTGRVTRALVRVALHESDRKWVEDLIAAHLESSDRSVCGVAVTCAGHVARIHGALDTARLLPMIRRLASDPDVAGRVADALDDIEMYVGVPPSAGRKG